MRLKSIEMMLWLVAFIALTSNMAFSQCLNPPVTPETISQFKLNPQSLITSANDTIGVEAATRDLAGTEPKLAPDLVHVAESAQPRFKAAIAAGLAQAALACLNVDQQGALLIQQAVAGFPDGQFQALFAAVAGDLSTAATTAAISAATSSIGSVVIINPNRSAARTQTPGGGGTGGSNNASGILAISGPNASSAVGTTASNPVSATR
jgi:hypothetical protein